MDSAQFPSADEMESLVDYCMAREAGFNPNEFAREEVSLRMGDFEAMESDLSRQLWQRVDGLKSELSTLSETSRLLDPHEAARPQISALEEATSYLEGCCEEVKQIIDRCIADQRHQTQVNRTLNRQITEQQRLLQRSQNPSPLIGVAQEFNSRALRRQYFDN